MVSAEAAGELDGASGGEAVGIAAVQFEGGAELSDEGGLPADSAGVVEALNNKVKLRTRKAYGFRTFDATKLALYHQLGKLPEPKLTHEFC